MKVVLVSQSYYPRPGGVTEHVHHTARGLRELGHDVTVVTSGFGNGTGPASGVVRIGRNVLVPINGAWVNMTVGANLAKDLRKVFDRVKPDVIHTHCPVAPTLPLLTLQVAPPGCKVIGTFHAAANRNLAYSLFKSYLNKWAKRLDTRIAVSNAALNLARKYVPGEYIVIPNGVDCSRFSPSNQPLDHLTGDAFNILYVGRLDKRKGLKHLFRAVTQVALQTDRRIRLVIVGDDGLRRHFLPRLPKRVELHLAGVVDAEMLPRYFASGHVLCSPATDRESFGIVLLEAMASGVPVIGTSIPGYLTILKHRWNSLVVPPKDSESLSTAIIELMNDEKLQARIRDNSLEFVRGYRWDKIVVRLQDVYKNGCETAPDRPAPRKTVLQGPIQVQRA